MSRGIVGKEAGEAVARVKVPSMYRKQTIKRMRRAQRSREKRRRKAADSFGFNGKGVSCMANIVVADKLALCYF